MCTDGRDQAFVLFQLFWTVVSQPLAATSLVTSWTMDQLTARVLLLAQVCKLTPADKPYRHATPATDDT